MSSAFREITDAIRECLVEVRAEFNRGVLPSSGWRVGRGEIREHFARPGVGWVRGSGVVQQPLSTDVFEQNGQRFTVRYTKRQTVQAWIWGEDEEATENLHDDVLETVARVMGQHANAGNFRWVTQEVEGFSWMHAGTELVIQDFEWPMLALGSAQDLVIIEAEEETGVLRSDVWTPG